MGILSQILKLTAISVFFSAAATVYVVDSDFYTNFLKKKNTPGVEKTVPSVNLSKDEIRDYREQLRKTRIETTGSATDKNSGKKAVWQNSYKN